MDIKRVRGKQEAQAKSPVKAAETKKETEVKSKKPAIPSPPKPPDPAEHMKESEEEKEKDNKEEDKTDYAGNIIKMIQDAEKERMNIFLSVQQAMISSDEEMMNHEGGEEENMDIE